MDSIQAGIALGDAIGSILNPKPETQVTYCCDPNTGSCQWWPASRCLDRNDYPYHKIRAVEGNGIVMSFKVHDPYNPIEVQAALVETGLSEMLLRRHWRLIKRFSPIR